MLENGKTFGQTLRSIRKAKGITVKMLKEKVGVSIQAISQYERDVRSPSLEIVKKIADALDVPIESLILSDEEISKQSDEILKRAEEGLKNGTWVKYPVSKDVFIKSSKNIIGSLGLFGILGYSGDEIYTLLHSREFYIFMKVLLELYPPAAKEEKNNGHD